MRGNSGGPPTLLSTHTQQGLAGAAFQPTQTSTERWLKQPSEYAEYALHAKTRVFNCMRSVGIYFQCFCFLPRNLNQLWSHLSLCQAGTEGTRAWQDSSVGSTTLCASTGSSLRPMAGI